jgi:hypothetical protein
MLWTEHSTVDGQSEGTAMKASFARRAALAAAAIGVIASVFTTPASVLAAGVTGVTTGDGSELMGPIAVRRPDMAVKAEGATFTDGDMYYEFRIKNVGSAPAMNVTVETEYSLVSFKTGQEVKAVKSTLKINKIEQGEERVLDIACNASQFDYCSLAILKVTVPPIGIFTISPDPNLDNNTAVIDSHKDGTWDIAYSK